MHQRIMNDEIQLWFVVIVDIEHGFPIYLLLTADLPTYTPTGLQQNLQKRGSLRVEHE